MGEQHVIKVSGLGKKFRIGEKRRAYGTLRDSIMDGLRRFGPNVRDLAKRRRGKKEEFWALRDISFEVEQGEVLGVIGHNGAGKSTLLKILSRITEPSEGTVDVYGRVGTLLEVGTGFHQELTGRENIYLSGAILGMKKADIDRRFDEIVSFAGVERFVDTPIKFYSSGMNLRLGFSVAAHLEPDILLVDEVLAVGDLEFQKKCLNKMEDVATEGRTVLFVSHNMGSIKELCRSALVLKNGGVDYHGDVVGGIRHYSSNVTNPGQEAASDRQNGHGWINLSIDSPAGDSRISNTEPFRVSADLSVRDTIEQVVIHCFLENSEGLQTVHNRHFEFSDFKRGTYRISAEVPPLYLKPGVYTLYLKLLAENGKDREVRFLSERLAIDVTDNTGLYAGKVFATILPPVEWSVAAISPKRGATT